MKKIFICYLVCLLIVLSSAAACKAQEPTFRVTWSNEKILPYEDAGLPNLSSDGEKVVFLRYKDNFNEIWTITSAGNDAKVILSDPPIDFNEPVWSPDGTKVVFIKRDFEMWVINADGAYEGPLTEKKYEKLSPVWWPDGSKIIFFRVDSDRQGLYVLDFVEKTLKPFGEPEWGGSVTFSPDGKTLLIMDGPDLIFLNLDGTIKEKRTVKAPLTHGEEPIWTPDGKYIILGNLLYVLATDEEIPFLPDELVRYKETGKPDLVGPKSITLSKDGKKVAFVMEQPNTKIYRARIKIMDLTWK